MSTLGNLLFALEMCERAVAFFERQATQARAAGDHYLGNQFATWCDTFRFVPREEDWPGIGRLNVQIRLHYSGGTSAANVRSLRDAIIRMGRPRAEADAMALPNAARLLEIPEEQRPHTGDGPGPPDSFRWRGATCRDLSTSQFRLLELLWDTEARAPAAPRPWAEVAAAACPNASDQDKALGELIRRTQKKLEADDVPLIVERANGQLRLLPL